MVIENTYEEKNIQTVKIDSKGNLQILANKIDVLKKDYTQISGQFIINAEDLCKIIPILNNNFATRSSGDDSRIKTAYGDIYIVADDNYIMSRDKAVEELNDKLISFKERLDGRDVKIDDLYDELDSMKNKSTKMSKIIQLIPKWILKLFIKNDELYEFVKNIQEED